MKIYSIEQLFQIAKSQSAFYKDLYKDIAQFKSLECLPVLKSESFWRGNTIENNSVLTGHQSDGIVFKSGGTTGNPDRGG